MTSRSFQYLFLIFESCLWGSYPSLYEGGNVAMIKLLIVDDERRTRESIKNFISWNRLGIGMVQTANNGLTALEAAKEIRPDIIICDVRMPKMDGIEFATNIKALYPNCRIIFISGYSDKEYLKSAIMLKAISYIEKPFSLRELEDVLAASITSIQEERQYKATSQILLNSIEVSLPLVREEIVLALISKKLKASEISEKYSKTYYNFPEKGLFTALCVLINWDRSMDTGAREACRPDLRQLIYTLNLEPHIALLAGMPDNERVALIADHPITCADKVSVKILEKIKEKFLTAL
jgi:two-component system response regulator YesN